MASRANADCGSQLKKRKAEGIYNFWVGIQIEDNIVDFIFSSDNRLFIITKENLKIYDHIFNGFGPSRNFSLEKVKTKYAFILDADERLTKNDFQELKKLSLVEKKRIINNSTPDTSSVLPPPNKNPKFIDKL